MWRTALIIIVLLLLLIFGAVNMHQTRVNVPFTGGFEVRTVLLLVVSFFLGYAVAYFVELARGKRE